MYTRYSRCFLCFFLLVLGAQNAFSGLKAVRFRWRTEEKATSTVFLAGTFNDWNPRTTPMADPEGDGLFETTLYLPPGRYLYKFVVDGRWMTDPVADSYEPDGQGGRNAVLVVSDLFPDVPLRQGDGHILTQGLLLPVDYGLINPLSDGRIACKMRVYRDDVERVYLLYTTGLHAPRMIEMVPSLSDETFVLYVGEICIGIDTPLWISFVLQDGSTLLFLTPQGFQDHEPLVEEMFFYHPQIFPPYLVPEWAQEGIFYQIFPDRFRNGDRDNDPDFSEPWYAQSKTLPDSGKTNGEYFHLVRDWQDIAGLTVSPYRTDGRPDYYSFYGGDIQGVEEKLAYLKDLGVDILYFNPLTLGKSNHKYDPIDYLTIDPHFADEATFRRFVKQAHRMGIRIIVDMAFNHTGDWHFAFVDTKEKGSASPYWHWYEWYRWPLPPEGCPTPCDYYDCWWGFPLHPNLNFDLCRPNVEENEIRDIRDACPNWDVVQYLFQSARYWIGALDIDGFRLDVPNEVPFWFWKGFRAVVDSLKKDAFLVGEIWGDAMPWLGPSCFHATMNYRYFRDPVWKFFGTHEIDARDFDRQLASGMASYPPQALAVMMNLIDSHDTERFLTVVGGDTRRQKLAVLFQMTYVGIPHIYYGDEVALEGGKDPDNRRPFPWDWERSEKRRDVHAFYRRVIQIRKKHAALRHGAFETLIAEGPIYAYSRQDAHDCFVILLNNQEKMATITFSMDGAKRFADLLTGKRFQPRSDGRWVLTVEPYGGRLLKKTR